MATSTLEIRPYQSADCETVVALWGQCGLLRPAHDPLKDIARKQKVAQDGVLSFGKRLEHDT